MRPRNVPTRPSRGQARAVSAVVGTILMVAVTVVLAAVLYSLVSGMGTAPAPTKPNMVLTPQSWNGGQLAVNVEAATGPSVNPADLTIIIADRNGTTCYSGAPGLNLSLCGVTVNVTFVDNAVTGKIGSGDSIHMAIYPSSSQALLGGRIRLIFQSGEIGAVTLP